jgi:predicted nucleotidyltransferase component of viral defense system
VEEKIEYSSLYKLQDKVLDIIFSLEHEFYLTGGTALHRFYYNLRYSDDLDFFSNNDLVFGENISEILNTCEKNGVEYRRVVQAKDFQRVMMDDFLQLDFVNDRVHREGKSNVINGMRIDNKLNILTNKIVAILNRDEEKDIFDLLAISYNEKFNWSEMLEIANKKALVERSFLIERLHKFPMEWLVNIKKVQTINISRDHLDQICRDISDDSDNSLCGILRIQ